MEASRRRIALYDLVVAGRRNVAVFLDDATADGSIGLKAKHQVGGILVGPDDDGSGELIVLKRDADGAMEAFSTFGATGLSLHAARNRAAAAMLRGCFMTQSE